MLIGQINARVGEKGRIAFPKRFREELTDNLIISYGFEESLIVVSESNWKQLLQGSEDKPFLLQKARDVQRFLLGSAANVSLDSQGRCILPDHLRSFAHIEDEIVFVGLYRYAEIWDKKSWEKQKQKAEQNISQIAEDLIDTLNS